MIDILIQEQGSGGEMLIRNNDLVMAHGLENMLMLAMFGGDNWWGNTLLLQGDQQFTSQTEKMLLATPLTSAGRIAIENAIISDLAFLEAAVPGTTVAVSTVIASKNRLDVTISINGNDFYLQWNPDTSFLNYSI